MTMRKLSKKELEALHVEPLKGREKLFLNRYLWEECKYDYMLIKGFKWPVYLALFIPVCILTFFYCLWDGGLKEFELPAWHCGGCTYVNKKTLQQSGD